MSRSNYTPSEKAKKYKEMYKRGLLTNDQLLALYNKGVLTKSEYQWIISDN